MGFPPMERSRNTFDVTRVSEAVAKVTNWLIEIEQKSIVMLSPERFILFISIIFAKSKNKSTENQQLLKIGQDDLTRGADNDN